MWDWLEKRPTCPMCRQPVDLDETGIRVLTYFDIKHAIRINRPADAESQSGISGVTGRGEEAETPVGGEGEEDGDGDGEESHMEPPATLKHVVEATTRAHVQYPPEAVNPETSGTTSDFATRPQYPPEAVDSETSGLNRGPLPPIPDGADNVIRDAPVQIENDHQRDLPVSAGTVTSSVVTSEEGRRLRRERRGDGKHGDRRDMRRPSNQDSRSRGNRSHHHGDQYYLRQQKHDQQHLGRTRRHSESRSQQQDQQQQQQQPQQHQQQHSPQRRPSSSPHPHHVTAPPDTPHAHGKRQSRRRCEICGRRYEGDPRDIVVGYISSCGHFYHCACLDGYIRKHQTCPRCHYENKEALKRGHHPALPERRVTPNEMFFAFLLDIINDAGADTQDTTTSRHSNTAGTRGRQNRAFVTEMQRF